MCCELVVIGHFGRLNDRCSVSFPELAEGKEKTFLAKHIIIDYISHMRRITLTSILFIVLFALAAMADAQTADSTKVDTIVVKDTVIVKVVDDGENNNAEIIEAATEIKSRQEQINTFFNVFVSVGSLIVMILIALLGIGWLKVKNELAKAKGARKISEVKIEGYREEALKAADEALKAANEAKAFTYHMEANKWLVEKNKPKIANVLFTDAIQLKPDFVEAYASRASAREVLGDYEKDSNKRGEFYQQAIKDIDTAIELDANLIFLLKNRDRINKKLAALDEEPDAPEQQSDDN